MFKHVLTVVVLLGFTAIGLAANPQNNAKGQLTAADRQFVTKAAGANMAEVELGRLAVEKASNAEVKQFGQKMIDDHSRALDGIKNLASQKSITIPTALDRQHQATRDRLSKLSGAAFDRAFMSEMTKDHDEAVRLFERQAASGTDPDVKKFAGDTLPTLKEHQRIAKEISSKLGGAKPASTKPASTKPGTK
jgi:putative membrane protein